MDELITCFGFFFRLHEQLMDLQQRQIDELASWLTNAEAKIDENDSLGSDIETIKRQLDEHKVNRICMS